MSDVKFSTNIRSLVPIDATLSRLVMFAALCFASGFFAAYAQEFLGEEYSKLPKLFHLDDYDDCLANQDGLYCLGTFHLNPEQEPHPVYQLMKKYSEAVYTFNRTVIHRGYCVSTRCPHSDNGTWPRNKTLRVEQCADNLARVYDMRAKLHTLHYCLTHEEAYTTSDPDIPRVIYLAVIALIIILNAGGTVYDVMTGDNPKKINVLLCWSLRASWKELTQSNNGSMHKPLAAIQGIRVAVAVSICFIHSATIYYTLYQYNPRFLEMPKLVDTLNLWRDWLSSATAGTHLLVFGGRFSTLGWYLAKRALEKALPPCKINMINITANPVTMLIQNSTAMEQLFVVLSSFLCVYSLQRSSKNLTFSFGLLLKLLVKRVFRISPLYLLVIGFTATWWPYISDGPLWPAMAVTESAICRDKFLWHAFFVNNLVEPEKYCVMPSWYLAVDIQMYVIAVSVTLLLARLRRGRIIILFICLLASIVLNGALAYTFEWKPMLYFFTVTEDIRTLFRDVPSFTHLYMSPWGNLSACFVGLIIGHLYPAMLASNFDVDKYKCVLNIMSMLAIPILFVWLLMGNIFQHLQSRSFVAVYAAVERSVFQVLCSLVYVMLSVSNSFMIRLFAWRGWQAIARLSLSVMLIHWCVNMTLVLPLPQPVPTSAVHILTVGAATTGFTFLLALPMTLLVEIPMIKFFHVVLSS